MRCVILAGGPVEDYSLISLAGSDMIVCADSGASHAKELGLVPDLIVGDMDSVDPELLAEFESLGCRVVRRPREKDEVDTELAINAALSAGADEIVIYGASGERLDHTLANLHLLAIPARLGVRAVILDRRHRVSLVTPGLPARVEGRGVTFSLIPLTSSVGGVMVRGAAWELDGAEFSIGKPYGVSNRVLAEGAEVSVAGGMLLLIELL